MIEGFSFVNKDILIPVFIGGLVLFGSYFYKEWVTRKQGNFSINIIVALLTIAALVILVLEPTREVEINDHQGILLSEGFNVQQRDSLLSLNKGLKVLKYNPKKSIRNQLDSLTTVYVLGEGIKPFDFSRFNNIAVEYFPANIPLGITQLTYTKKISLGEKVEVIGSYNQPVNGSFLVFEDSRGNGLDSIQFVESSFTDFTLSGSPKASGNYVYQLSEKDSAGVVINSNPLPIEIKQKQPLRVLILNNFPTFETKYLKNFLSEEGHEVVVRSQLTKGKFKFEYFNTTSLPVYQFTDEILKQFDLVIVDADTYFSFGSTIKNRFEKNIRENGLGVFIQPSDFIFNRSASWSYFRFNRDDIKEVQILNSTIALEKYPYEFDEEFLVSPIIVGDGKAIAAYKQMALGRVATTTLLGSYQMLLNGSDQIYKSIWTNILDEIAKPKIVPIEWKAETQIPKVDEPFDFSLYTNQQEFAVIDEDSVRTPMLQKLMVSTHFTGTIYPKKTGWQHLSIDGDSTSQFSFFVYDSVDWKALSSTQNIVLNKKKFKTDVNKNKTVISNRPVSPLLFYILFLLGVGWLWLSPKVSIER
ncbi:hypothetical protein [Maribacter arcticus]|uniref:Uncharacterized protein n=1 Tax=Maribacter arcticus TaxID=561365 RepID=A0A1T5CRV7_9FLAO|nr:hypothetical protein [Maribacter arcticus]SKB62073.1 hypothetical protein SAMN05660866_02404 [Maribacter arcticus]